MSDASESSMARRSIRELTYALIAGGITLAISFGLYLMAPKVLASIHSPATELQHPRVYRALADGGEIEYQTSKSSPQVAPLKQDLEILGRRFERGQFEMTGIAGARHAEPVKNMNRHRGLRTSVTEKNGAAVLRIQTNDGGAVRDLHAYLKYLEARWTFGE